MSVGRGGGSPRLVPLPGVPRQKWRLGSQLVRDSRSPLEGSGF